MAGGVRDEKRRRGRIILGKGAKRRVSKVIPNKLPTYHLR